VTSDSRASFALDLGSATSSAAILGRVNGRRRLLASESTPAGGDPEDLLALLVSRLADADPGLADELGLDPTSIAATPRLVARTAELPRLAILATSERERAAVERLAATAGWRSTGLSMEASDEVALARLALDHDVAAVVLAAGESPALDPKPAVAALAALGAALAGRDPARPFVLAGLLRTEAARFAVDATGAPLPYGPAATAGDPPGEGLRRLLDAIHPGSGDGRHALVRAVTDLATVLDRRVELVEIGLTGGPPGAGRDRTAWRLPPAFVEAAALAPAGEPDDSLVDGVLAWSSIALDRHRMRDRLRELRLTPWGEAHGAGAVVRYAAARAALERLVEATPAISELPAPDLIVVAGGAWAVAPGPAIALAVADLVRRPGASQLAWDHARLLGPIGMADDQAERRSLLAELAEDLLVPLGTVVTPAGLRAGKSAGRLTIHGESGSSEIDLVPGRPAAGGPAARPAGDRRVPVQGPGRHRPPGPARPDRGRRGPGWPAGRPARRAPPAARPARPAAGHARRLAGGALAGTRCLTMVLSPRRSPRRCPAGRWSCPPRRPGSS
jgi:hypothetical protein